LGSPLDSLLGAYSRLPIPTREEQVLLGRAIRKWLDWDPSPEDAPPGVKRSGRRAREQMVSRNMLLVARQARSFSVSSVVALEVQDLIQEGAIGLSRAAEKFDPTRGCSFSTYAVPWIRQSMTRLVHTSGPIRIPVKRASSMNQLRQWVEAFTAREGRSPTDEEAIEGMEITAADLRILRQAAAVRQVGSLDALMGDGDGDSFLSTVAAPMAWASGGQRDLVLEALKTWPDLQEVMDRQLAGQGTAEISLAMGITRKAAVKLADRAQAMAQRLVATQGKDPGAEVSLELAVVMEIEQQLSLFPLPA
jgi:RNA polymerase sigma factor (sigma-70 family)